ncbi:non-ribosomal peptide synthetase [Micromonospora lutea]|uniref:Carrier domain-containing protein n=1 Tax=Micromonospora lutea TaxID=419825 RepID=A0ABQ4IT25_9ACTN|nr:non-ribosomal peptide synthetase [Micromonospora lutea]GIJ21055.1 hypothetical protein Vlu01_16790 [Micromonospora lutea]
MTRAGDTITLTAGQRGLWYLHLLAPGDTAYNTCTAIALTGPLSPAALGAAIAAVGLRHDTLRAVIRDCGELSQTFAAVPAPLRLVDLTGLPAADREPAARQAAERLAAVPFDLVRGPLVRWLLLRLAADRHLLVFDAHHIIFDRTSLAVVCAELTELYAAYVAGDAVTGARQRRDAQAVSRMWQPDGAGLVDSVEYWRAQLADAPPSSTPFPAPAGSVMYGAGSRPVRYAVTVGDTELAALAGLCAEEGASVFMALLAASACLIGRYSGQRDIVVGAPVSLRSDADELDVVGLLVNVVPLRVRLPRGATFRDVLRQARDRVLDALDHRHVPLDRILDALGSTRAADASPLFQVLVAHQTEAPTPALAGVATELVPVPAATAKYGLTLTATVSTAGVAVLLEADHRVVTPEELAAFGRHLRTLLRGFVDRPATAVDAIDLMDATETSDTLRRGRGPIVPRPPGASMHGLFAEAYRLTPDAVALLAGGPDGDRHAVSYRALYRAATSLAAVLRDQGVTVDRPIAVLLERGIGLAVAYLGVLFAGGAVMPLEPEDPDGRLAVRLRESGAPLVVTGGDQLDRCRRWGLDAVDVNDHLRAQPARPVAGCPAEVHPAQAAYVLFTSGSSGEPKGVVVPHRGIVNRLLWMRENFPLATGERCVVKTPITFDVSIAELFRPLVAGGTAVLVEAGGERDPRYLVDLVAQERVVFCHFVPSMLGPFLSEVEATGRRLPELRLVVCSGEALPAALVDRTHSTLDVEIHNFYGPTEASVEVLTSRCDPGNPVSIGHPISNTECRILDSSYRPVPPAAVGEVFLGGDCLARGYLRQPTLTAMSFVPAPRSTGGARLYRTGDFGHRASDGAVHLHGRRDRQLKILGRRVEPGEVSELIRQQPGVLDGAVVPRHDHLVAFVVADPHAATAVTPETLRAALSTRLPSYLVPAAIEMLPALPSTTNGKADLRELDRRAALIVLPAMAGTPPRTDLERRLVELWSGVLGRAAVGVDVGFFEAGGNSMALLRLHQALVAELAVDLTVRELFSYPTIAALARYLAERDAVLAENVGTGADVLARAGRRRGALAAGRSGRARGAARG